jgi:hypothetical protein
MEIVNMFKSHARRAACVVALVTIVASAGGCADPKPEVVQVDGIPAADASDAALLNWAEQTFTGECMVRAGFTYLVADWRVADATSSNPDNGYGTDDVAWAEANGYGIGDESAPPVNPNRHYADSLPQQRLAAYSAALNGTAASVISIPLENGPVIRSQTGGCIGTMQTQMYGDSAAWARLKAITANFQLIVSPKVQADPRYTAALAAWRTCMSDAGITATSPTAARAAVADYSRQSAGSAAREHERIVAVQDARCSGSTRLTATAAAVAEEYLAAVRQRYRADIDDRDRRQAAALDRARAALNSAAAARR